MLSCFIRWPWHMPRCCGTCVCGQEQIHTQNRRNQSVLTQARTSHGSKLQTRKSANYKSETRKHKHGNKRNEPPRPHKRMRLDFPRPICASIFGGSPLNSGMSAHELRWTSQSAGFESGVPPPPASPETVQIRNIKYTNIEHTNTQP